MVKLELLERFAVNRCTPPMLAPETDQNRKKEQAYMLLAPTIEQEFEYLATTDILKFRHIYNYFIEKRWDYKFYGKGRVITKFNEDGGISDILNAHKQGNLTNIKGVTSYLPTYSSRPMKNMNVLVECNHIHTLILGNDRDKRVTSKKVPEIMSNLARIADTSYLGSYKASLFIPLELWFDTTDYANPAMLIRKISKKTMGVILEAFSDVENLKPWKDVYLILGNYVLILNSNIPTTDNPKEYILDLMRRFVAKAKSSAGKVIDTSEEENDPEVVDTTEHAKKTERDIKGEDLIKSTTKVDPDTVSHGTIDSAADIAEKMENNPEYEPIGSREKDVLVKAELEGRSVASTKRNEMLKEKYKTLKFGDRTIEDIQREKEVQTIPEMNPDINTINDNLKSIKTQQFEAVYNESLMEYDLINILTHFSKAHPAMYLNKDIKIEDVSTSTDRMIKYTVEFEDENRKRHHFSFLMPKIYQEKYLYLNDMKLNISHQKLPFPITKISADRCQLVTNYNKVQVYRYGTSMSPRINKIKKILLDNTKSRYITVRKGDSTKLNSNKLTTVEFDDLGASFVNIGMGTPDNLTNINFVIDNSLSVTDIRTKPTIEGSDQSSIYPIGTKKRKGSVTNIWIDSMTNHIYDNSGKDYGELSEFIINSMIEIDPKMEAEFASTTGGARHMYSKARIMKRDIPLIFVMGAAAPGGLTEVLEKAKVNYEFYEKRPSDVDKNTKGIIPFADGYMVFDRYPYENSLLVNGLNSIPTKEFNFYDFDTRDCYVEVFDLIAGQKSLADNMESFYYMMVDPITYEILERLNMPTDFITLLAYCNASLADNTFQLDSNYENSRIRSNEIINAYLYRELAVAWSEVKVGRAEKFSIPQDCIIKACLTSNIIDPHSKLNLALELENDRTVKLKGPSGMNEDRSFTLEKRAYHPSMVGVVAVNSTPSGKVAIARHLTVNSNIDDARGFMTLHKGYYDGTEMLSPAEALQTFTVESADMERVGMAINQSKHTVPSASQCSAMISYDMERVAPYMSNDYAYVAKKNGKVVSIDNEILIIQYDDGTYDDVDLSEIPADNTDGGFFIMNQMTTDLKPGNRVKAGQIVAFDRKYINGNDMYGDPCANFGTLARVALEINGMTYEDSAYITDSFAHRMATKITKQKRVILSKFANVQYIAKKGQKVVANDPILTFDDTADEFSSQMLASMAEQMGDADEFIGTGAPVVSKYTGVIKDIFIYYTVPLNELSPSLRKIVEAYAKEAGKREKTLGKYRNIYDGNTILRNSDVTPLDSQGKAKGVKVGEGVFIDFYIEYDDVMKNGDKGTS